MTFGSKKQKKVIYIYAALVFVNYIIFVKNPVINVIWRYKNKNESLCMTA